MNNILLNQLIIAFLECDTFSKSVLFSKIKTGIQNDEINIKDVQYIVNFFKGY